ncbi:hypothetical protein B0T16DRAFT_417146 [Cercophora newfieldiana]|uniref:RING-type domain-containing protein n=1 Tax=Cercophora newfieldiana TaxID=92897 RepID=A0AA39Y164_9PEZI|nr:hypothetical protein B0T16DRAFT_417146 [Cercophora newfieldiana]
MSKTTDYIVCGIFFGASLFCALLAALKTPSQSRRIAALRDLEAQRQARAPRPKPTRLDIQALDSIAAAKNYKDLKSEDINFPPDQTGESVECVICLEDFQSDSSVRCLPCHHIFHSECITKWLIKRHATCPLCMAKYVPDEMLPAEPPRVQPYPEFHAALAAAEEGLGLEPRIGAPRQRESV